MTDIRLATVEDQQLPTFDNTKLVAINTCPTWGIIRYEHHKTVATKRRPMALEAGSACHQAFAAVRYADLLIYGPDWFPNFDKDFVISRGRSLFGEDRFTSLLDDFNKDTDPKQRTMLMGLSALHASGFYDDPEDKKRTLTNLEASIIDYSDNYKLNHRLPVCDPKLNLLGVEVPFDTVITFDNGKKLRFIGRCDGLTYNGKNERSRFRIGENKTSSRLGEAWEISFDLSHQVTGYCVGASTYLQGLGVLPGSTFISDASIFGTAIPIPKYTTDYNGNVHVPVTRRLDQIQDWLGWLAHTLDTWERYRSVPLSAPRYTHSCNRYFRPCPLVPICSAPTEERIELYESLVHDEWSPLEEGNE